MAEKEKEKKTTEKKTEAKKTEAKKTTKKAEDTKAKAKTKAEDAKTEAKKATKKAEDTKTKAKTKTKAEDTKAKAKKEAAEVAEAAETKQPEIDPNPKRQKKKEQREAKAARKAANAEKEKKTTPNNKLLAALIFGILIAMFVFVGAYNYFSKPASIEKYIEENGGEELYSNMQMDEYTTANITAKGNNLNIEMTAETDDEEGIEAIKDFYGGEDGEHNLKDLGAYFLTTMKPEVRGFSGKVDVKLTLNGEELNSISMTYSEAKKFLKEEEKESEEEDEEEIELDAEEGEEINLDDIEFDEDGEEIIIDDGEEENADQ